MSLSSFPHQVRPAGRAAYPFLPTIGNYGSNMAKARFRRAVERVARPIIEPLGFEFYVQNEPGYGGAYLFLRPWKSGWMEGIALYTGLRSRAFTVDLGVVRLGSFFMASPLENMGPWREFGLRPEWSYPISMTKRALKRRCGSQSNTPSCTDRRCRDGSGGGCLNWGKTPPSVRITLSKASFPTEPARQGRHLPHARGIHASNGCLYANRHHTYPNVGRINRPRTTVTDRWPRLPTRN